VSAYFRVALNAVSCC